jgi:hypothetical protein
VYYVDLKPFTSESDILKYDIFWIGPGDDTSFVKDLTNQNPAIPHYSFNAEKLTYKYHFQDGHQTAHIEGSSGENKYLESKVTQNI